MPSSSRAFLLLVDPEDLLYISRTNVVMFESAAALILGDVEIFGKLCQLARALN